MVRHLPGVVWHQDQGVKDVPDLTVNRQGLDINKFWLARPLQDVFLLSHIPLTEQGGSILLVALLYDLFYGLTILS